MVRHGRETTVTLAVAVKDQLAEVQRALREERGRAVTYNEVVEFLLEARRELARLVMTADEGGA